MKKLTLIALPLCLTSCLVNTPKLGISPSDIEGEWTCVTYFDDYSIENTDEMTFNASGTFTTESTISGKKVFNYKSLESGSWTLDGDTIVGRKHQIQIKQLPISAQQQNSINSSYELQEYGQKLSKMIDDYPKAPNIRMNITDYQPNVFHFTHPTSWWNTYTGTCTRKSEKQPVRQAAATPRTQTKVQSTPIQKTKSTTDKVIRKKRSFE